MDFFIAAHTDAGLKKQTNQDALLVKTARTAYGKCCLCVMCDGMGGLDQGEKASGAVIKAFERWFLTKLPRLLQTGIEPSLIWEQWRAVIWEVHQKLRIYGQKHGFRLGTTAAVLFITGGRYFAANIGDSRIYMIQNSIHLLTKDHTFVRYEADHGRMTDEEASCHPKKHILIRCIGASETAVPDFFEGSVSEDTVFMLCSDGFRHQISHDEFLKYLLPESICSEEAMEEKLVYLTELNKQRHETDNISAILIKTGGRGDAGRSS